MGCSSNKESQKVTVNTPSIIPSNNNSSPLVNVVLDANLTDGNDKSQ
jgi:hypothetical protein